MGKLIPSRADRLFGANVFADFCSPPEERIKSQVCSFCSAKLYRNTKLAKRFSKFSKKLSTLEEINFKKKMFKFEMFLYNLGSILERQGMRTVLKKDKV